LIVELSTKHFGVSSEVMVEGALQGADSLVSAALILASGRNQSDLKLSEILKSEGIRGVCSIFTKYVKEITESHTCYTAPQMVLRDFFSASLKDWNFGYKKLQELHSEAKHEINMVLVKEWLMRNTRQGRILHKNPTTDSQITSEFIRRVLLQHCDIKDNIEAKIDISNEADGPIDICLEVGPMKFKSASLRFNDLISKMPIKLRLTLAPMSGPSWFDQNVSLKGKKPTKAALKTTKNTKT
jgi:hypothetical protein